MKLERDGPRLCEGRIGRFSFGYRINWNGKEIGDTLLHL